MSIILNKQIRTLMFYITVLIIIVFTIFHKHINHFTDKWRFRNLEIVDIKETPYGKLTAIKQDNHFSFYNNGVFLFSTSDNITPEIDVSLAVAESRSIDNILIVNNGIAGLIKNLIKYKHIKNITYIEYNKFLLNQFLNNVPAEYLNDNRVHLIINDPRNILKRIKKKYNIIFLNNGDPYNLLINRFFTVEFFNQLKSIMAPGGIILLKLTSSENFINKYQSLYIGSIMNTLKSQFKEVIAIPGDICYLLASNTKGVLTYDQEILNQRIKKFNVKSDFFNNYFLKFNLDQFRVNSFLNTINMKAKKNYDLNPISFFYGLVLWTTRTSQAAKKIFFFFYNVKFYIILSLIFILFLILNFRLLRAKKNLVLLSMGIIGFTEISLEILCILIYQVIRGNLYINMSFIFFSFMLGLSIGSYIYKYIKLSREKLFVLIQFLFIFIPILLVGHYFLVKSISITVIQDILFFIFILGFSILSGIQFPAAVNLYPDKIFGPGKINGIDLFSAGIGAFVISLFIIPLYGLFNSVILLVLLNLLAFIKIAELSRKRATL